MLTELRTTNPWRPACDGYQNAMKWYSFDPFQHRSKQNSTVAALRAEAGTHDVEIRPFDKGRFTKQIGIDLGELQARATA